MISTERLRVSHSILLLNHASNAMYNKCDAEHDLNGLLLGQWRSPYSSDAVAVVRQAMLGI